MNSKFKYIYINSALVVLFYYFLWQSFVSYIVPKYAYAYERIDFTYFKLIESVLLFCLVYLSILILKPSRFIYLVSHLLLINLFIPNLILYSNLVFDRAIIYSISFFIIQIILFSKVKIFQLKSINISESNKIRLLILITVIFLIPFLLHYNVKFDYRIFLLDSIAITEIRQDSIESTNLIVAYASSWITKVLIPILLVYAILKKSKFIILFCVFVLIYMFLVESMKLVLFSIALLLVFYLFVDYYKKATLILTIFISLILIGRIVNYISDDILIDALVVNRTFFIPAILNQYYFEFFNDNYLWYSSSIFSSFIDYPYNLAPSYLIGDKFFGSELVGANNGVISDGFMNMGYIGVLFNSSIVALFFSFLNSLNVSSRFFGVFYILITTIFSSALFTSIITHGVFFLLIMTFLILKDTKKFDI